MNNKGEISTYKLLELTDIDEDILKVFYKWYEKEDNFQYYTCRPFKKHDNYKAYKEVQIQTINSKVKTFYLRDSNDSLLGKLSFFDYNERNRSGEFGYYFPMEHRNKGYGSILIKLFLKEIFSCDQLKLNKLYATTASSNKASIKLLDRYNFKLDGVIREHYFIDSKKYDQHHYSMLRSEWSQDE